MLDEEALRQFAYLSSLLASFSVMVTVGLLSLKDARKIVSWVIGVMVLASVLFLTSRLRRCNSSFPPIGLAMSPRKCPVRRKSGSVYWM
jgi:hypothetical protein